MPDNFFQNLHDRISYRAKWHNYNCGMYFVTICTKNREHYFGEINNGVMNLSEIGKCLHEQIVKTPEMRADMNMEIPLFVIMPDHVHLIVTIGENQYNTPTCGEITHCGETMHCGDAMHCRGAMHCAPTMHCVPTMHRFPTMCYFPTGWRVILIFTDCNNQVYMVWHYDKQWNFHIHISTHFRCFDNLFMQTFANFR